MSKFIEQLGQQVGSSLVGDIYDLTFGGIKRKNQIKQQQKLTDIGTNASKELMAEQRKHQLGMWEDTNFAAQMEQMRKAGLNPAMIYGGGGEGTTGTIGASSTPSGQASDEAELMQAQAHREGMALMRRKEKAQIEEIEALADKHRADAESTRGQLGGRIEGMATDIELKKKSIEEITQNIKNKEIQRIGNELQNDFDKIRNQIKELTAGAEITRASYYNYKLEAEVNTILQNYDITKEQKKDILMTTKMQVKNLQADLLVKASQGELNEASATKALTEAENYVRSLDIKDADVKMKETVAHIMKTKPNVWNVAGDHLERQLNSLEKLGQPIDWALNKIGVTMFENKYSK